LVCVARLATLVLVTIYELYVESGPKRRKTMVHVPALLGCIATGGTTDEALEAAPDAIRRYLRFLRRHGEAEHPDRQIETVVRQHVTQGDWLGNGSPYLVFDWDLAPISEREIEAALRHFLWARGDLSAWAAAQSQEALDAEPAGSGRPARAVILHLLGAAGYLSAALGGMKGYSAIHTQAERGLMPLDEALLCVAEKVAVDVHAATPEQRVAIIERPKDVRTLRKGLRRTLEHDWEHYTELARRTGGPPA
jgi:predicted RNase H-like HicB family nuclease/uncharacterized damage-inducible protein DinB